MTATHTVALTTIRGLQRLLLRVHGSQLNQVPMHGPLILVPNHINFLDAPVLYTYLQPRKVTALAKIETWNNPILRFLFNMGEGIPLRRGEADIGALRRGLAVLESGHILTVAPEGTRSNHGRLQRGHPGVVLLALHSRAPLLPLACYGGEQFRRNLAHLRRTDFHVVVGQPFYVDCIGNKVMGALRQRVADEIMYQLAALLPPAYRGYYSDLSSATEDYLRFDPPYGSNLRGAMA